MSKPRSRRVSPRAAHRPSPRRRSPSRSPVFEPLEARELLATFIVNTTGDVIDPTDGVLSLREAITFSNSSASGGVPNLIAFNLPGSGIRTIGVVSTPLPTITQPVIIDGYSQAGASVSAPDKTEVDLNNALVRVDGSALGTPPAGQTYDGLAIASANCQVDGLIVTGFHDAGVSISGPGSQGNWVWGNFLGALPDPATGRSFAGNSAAGNLGQGIRITSSNNRIGGDTPGLPNVLANDVVGLLIDTPGGTGNLIQGNVVVGNVAQGVFVRSSNNTIGEALTGGGNVIAGNGAEGVLITGGPTAQGNQLLGNFIGTDLGTSDGKVTKGTFSFPNQADGILILDSPRNFVGGSNAATRNVIGPNRGAGVSIVGAASTGNHVLNNSIGFNIVGGLIVFLPNQNGISITAPGNVIGDPNGGSPNTIDNNYHHGILLSGAGASGNTIAGNVIGLNPNGASAFPNAFDGIRLDNAPNNTIGGTTAGARNTISANNNGVYLFGPGSTGNLVEGNFIGTAVDGVTDLGNAVDGVVIDNASYNTVGGTAAGAGNVIAGNNRGVRITGAGSVLNSVQGNFIGTDLTGSRVITNKIDGVFVTAGASNNTVGGGAAAAGNTIAYNVGAGVNVDSGTGNSILTNSIFENIRAGIILNPAGSANNLQPAPVLTYAAPNTTSISIGGTIVAAPNTQYTIQFFASPTQPAAGHEQGRTPLYTAVVTTDGTGYALISQRVPQVVPAGQWVTATATDLLRNTSVFSAAIPAVPVGVQFSAATYTVSESGRSATITVTRIGGSNGVDTVDYTVGGGTAVGGVDYAPVSGTLVFNTGVLSRTFSVPIIDAKKVGGSVAVNLSLSNPTNDATLGNPSVSTLTILDDDPVSVRLNTGSISVNEDARSVQFTVIRNSPVGTATVNYATADGTARAGVNYANSAGTVTFNVGETTRTITIPVLDDHAITGTLTFSLLLSNPVNLVLDTPSSATVREVNTDTPGGALPIGSQTFVVNTTADDNTPDNGILSLREAIALSNITAPGGVPNIIEFAIGGAGVHTISPLSPLPRITSAVIIDGYYNTGATINTAPGSYNANLTIQLDGSLIAPPAPGQRVDGLVITSSNCVVSGLIITGFTGAGVWITPQPGQPPDVGYHGNWLWGNFIGTVPDATPGHDLSTDPALRNGTGVLVTASNNLIGGSDVGLRNVINNNGIGVVLDTQTGVGTLVENNLILDNVTQGVLITSSNNTIGGETAGRGNVISGNGTEGILITGDPVSSPYTVDTGGINVQGNGVFNNLIGLDLVGNRPRINASQQQTGVRIKDSARNNIGSVNSQNVIVGHVLDGVTIEGHASSGNRVLNNAIGFNSGSLSNPLSNLTYLPNRDGVAITSPNNVIAGNTISNNHRDGVRLAGAWAFGNLVRGNIIGLTPAGDADIGNPFEGVYLDNAPINVIAGNTISGNNNGVYLFGLGSTGNQIQGNFIGTDAGGTRDLGNAIDGVLLDNAPGNLIGGTAAGAGNVISGNNNGVRISGPQATANLVQGNAIGTNKDHTLFLHNEVDGVIVTAGASGNTIGGADPTFANTIVNNIRFGINLQGAGDNAILTNTIQNNLGGGISPALVGFPAGGATYYGPGVAWITVNRNTPNGTATVQYATADGSAVAGINYLAASGTLTFKPGETTQSVPVAILDDSLSHAAPLTFGLALSQPTGVALGAISRLVVSDVTSNAAGSFQLGNALTVAGPGATVAAVTVVRTDGKTGAAAVDYATGGGTARPRVDYTPVSGTLNFAPGETSRVVYVPVFNTGTPGTNTNFTFGLGNPTGGASIGPLIHTTVSILHPRPGGSGGPVADNSVPVVTDVLPLAGASGFNTVVITFSKPMDATRATAAANYVLTYNGRDVPISKAGYDPSANHTALYLGTTIPFGVFLRLDIKGLTDASGLPLDGSGTGHNPGSTFSALFGEGRQLAYTDRSGDAVALNLAGPGFLALRRGLDGEAQVLRFVGTQANASTLTGQVTPKPGKTGTTSIPSLTGAAGVKIRLSAPPFYLGGITASAVDALAVAGGLNVKSRS